jgi:hypothetical protein
MYSIVKLVSIITNLLREQLWEEEVDLSAVVCSGPIKLDTI